MLGALRNCAGALADLCEGDESGPFGAAKTGPSGKPLPEKGRWPEDSTGGGEKEDVGAGTSSGSKAKAKEEEGSKEKPKPKKKDRKKRDKPVKGTKAKKTKEEEVEKEETRSEESEGDAEERRRLKAEESGERPALRRRTSPAEKEVRDDPRAFGLETIPARGSVGRHFEQHHGRGHQAPPEPPGPPPGRVTSDYEEYLEYKRSKERERSPGKAKKEKGYNHWKRGREHWRSRNPRR